MVRILHGVLIMSIDGGIQNKLMSIYRRISRESIQFDFLCYNDDRNNCLVSEIESLGGRVYYVSKRRTSIINNIKETELFFQEHACEYSAFHFHLSSASNIIYAFYAKKFGIKEIIVHSRSNSSSQWYNRLAHYVNRIILKKYTTNAFAISDLAGKWLFGNNANYKILPNAIDVKCYTFKEEKRKAVREKYNFNCDFIVGHIGRFHPLKNHKFLLEIFAEICNQKPDSLLALVGTGGLKNEIEEKAKSLGIESRVRFLGVGMPIDEILCGFDVFVFPSRYEGFGNVLLEAQATGLQTFASEGIIPKSAKVTELIEYISIKKPASYWASQVLRRSGSYKRRNTSSEIIAAGFDLDKSIKWYENFYLACAGQKNNEK